MARFKVNWFVAVRGLAGVLAGALLLFELLSTNGQFHQAFHPVGKTRSNSCVVCLFAKGDVDSPLFDPIVTASVRPWFAPPLRTQPAFLADFTYLASASRAPPALSSFPPVLA